MDDNNIERVHPLATNILITGSNGFIGRNLLSHLPSAYPGAKISCLVRSPQSEMPGVTSVEVNYADSENLSRCQAIQDADLIFLAADASAGRLLKSQLKFHYSGDLPVYSTSSIYAMDDRSNSDLNGVMFADAPWIIGPQSWIQHLPVLFEQHWPEQRRLGRLHAMGYDAYYLVGSLFAARGGFMDEVDGATGKLYVDKDGRVHRRMAWAQFQRGMPVSLPDAEPIGGPFQDMSEDGEQLPPDATDAESWYESPRDE